MEYTIMGHTVRFPHQAYGVQLSFMSKVVQTLGGGQNALLEAPTGSGKTLSLLCAALAWQERAKIEHLKEVLRKRAEEQAAQQAEAARKEQEGKDAAAAAAATPAAASADAPAEPLPQRLQQPEPGPQECRDLGHSDGEGDTQDPSRQPAQPKAKEKRAVPRIFYATRTHSQIAQVVRELKRCSYRPKMAILASREHYCVNKAVARKANKDEECDRLLASDASCSYFRNATSRLYGMQTSPALQVHDIEDLCQVGISHRSCPYYTSRHFAGEADLVFCPYSYLIDPVIRAALDLDISGAVIIFDEAHNIEDQACEAASAELELAAIEEAAAACGRMSQLDRFPELFGPIGRRLGAVAGWLQRRASVGLQQAGFDRLEGVWAGQQALDELQQAGLCQEGVAALQQLYTRLRAEEDKEREAAKDAKDAGSNSNSGGKEGGAGLKLAGAANAVISRLLATLQLMYKDGGSHVADYRLAVQHWQQSGGGGGRRGRRGAATQADGPGWVTQLRLWCLNPAVAFAEVEHRAHSIVLTSGTLAPLDSFASELGAAFPVRLEAPHVVNTAKQVLATVVGCGPGGAPVCATYRHTSQENFQDAIGAAVCEACAVVPDGVLVFLPSYSLLERLTQRWQASGLWARLQALKPVACEPRGSGEDFDAVMGGYYDSIRRGRGGVFFAVCRGKVSEGLDFADANARCVLIVGIPFPNVKDTRVGLKKRYNDEGSRKRGLLTGDLWYSQQAFRALNQAVGRCLRHRNDFGAILLLDERYTQLRNQRHLSRWVRGALTVSPSFEAATQAMGEFFQRQRPVEPPSGAAPAAAPAQLPPPPPRPRAAAERPAGKETPPADCAQPTLASLWQRKPQQKQPARAPAPVPQPAGAAATATPRQVGKRKVPSSWSSPATAVRQGWVVDPEAAGLPQAGSQWQTQSRGRGAPAAGHALAEAAASPGPSGSPACETVPPAQPLPAAEAGQRCCQQPGACQAPPPPLDPGVLGSGPDSGGATHWQEAEASAAGGASFPGRGPSPGVLSEDPSLELCPWPSDLHLTAASGGTGVFAGE